MGGMDLTQRRCEVDPILRAKKGLDVACSVTHPDSTRASLTSLRDLRFRLWELWETRSVSKSL